MTKPWRYRCPEGHTSITRSDHGYRCRSCERRYRGEPVDMTADRDSGEQSFEPFETLGPLEVTHMLWRETGDTDTTAHARTLPVQTQVASNALVKAETRGYVARFERSRAARWYVTEAGERLVTYQGSRDDDGRAEVEA